VLKAQGTNAGGGARGYVVNGHMIGGFALVAFPAKSGILGVMTFIINQDGILYQKKSRPRHDQHRDGDEDLRSGFELEDPGGGARQFLPATDLHPRIDDGPAARRAIRAAGAKLFFLPPYSPDLNPIEQVFAKLKTLLRKVGAEPSRQPGARSARSSPISPTKNAPATLETLDTLPPDRIRP
jgi:hypothetical protein